MCRLYEFAVKNLGRHLFFVKVVETGEFKIWTEDFMDACDGRLPPSQELKECESYTKLVQGMRETWKDGKVIRTEKGTFGRDMQVVEQ